MRIKREITRVAQRVADGVNHAARRVEDTARFLARGISDYGVELTTETVQQAQAEDYTRRAVVVGHAAPLLNGIVQLVDRATLAPGKGVANASPADRRHSGGLYSKLASEVSKNVEANGFPPYPFRPLGPARAPLAYPPLHGAASPTDFYAGRRRFGEALGKLDEARSALSPSPALAQRFEAFDAMTDLLGTLRLPAAA